MNKSRVISTLFCLLLPFLAFAQLASTGFTPYSIFGVGDLTKQGTTYSQHLAGLGTGERNLRYINIINPAAVTAIEQKSFMMDFGLRQNNVLFQSADSKSANNTFNLDHLVLAFPIAKKGAFHFGVNTFSSVGYNFQNLEKDDALIAEVGDLRYYNYGEGGIYRGFVGLGFKFFERLSVGVDGLLYFGNISHYNTSYFNTNSAYRTINIGNLNSYKGLSAKLGVQYEQPLGDRHHILTLGATYQFKTNIKGTAVNYAFGTSSVTDTIKYEVVNLEGYNIPSEMSAGLSYRYSDRVMAGFDYTRQNWSNTNFIATEGVDFKPCCAQSFRFGVEVTPDRYDIRYYLMRVTYRAGLYYEDQYISLNGHQIKGYGLTFGISLPVFRYYNSVNIGVDLGKRGSIKDGLISEKYAMLTLGFSFHDIWFIKQLYD